MHQKNNQSADPSSASLHNDDDDDLDLRDPFADGDDDIDDDDDLLGQTGRGSWWRGVVTRQANQEERGSDDGNERDEDEEFGDFAMADDETGRGDDNVVLKPLAVNPSKDGNRGGLSGLWPFGSKEKSQQQLSEEGAQGTSPVDVASEDSAGQDPSQTAAVEVKEAKRRTSIEDPDDDEPVKV